MRARKAERPGRSGVKTGYPAARAASFTGVGRGRRPRPARRSGCVTTPAIS